MLTEIGFGHPDTNPPPLRVQILSSEEHLALAKAFVPNNTKVTQDKWVRAVDSYIQETPDQEWEYATMQDWWIAAAKVKCAKMLEGFFASAQMSKPGRVGTYPVYYENNKNIRQVKMFSLHFLGLGSLVYFKHCAYSTARFQDVTKYAYIERACTRRYPPAGF
jgi:hypothetical protein